LIYCFQKKINRSQIRTRYRSEKTETSIISSLKRTFSPSLRCFDAGCIVHQQDSPEELTRQNSSCDKTIQTMQLPCVSSFKPTSKASLSFDVLVDKQLKY